MSEFADSQFEYEEDWQGDPGADAVPVGEIECKRDCTLHIVPNRVFLQNNYPNTQK